MATRKKYREGGKCYQSSDSVRNEKILTDHAFQFCLKCIEIFTYVALCTQSGNLLFYEVFRITIKCTFSETTKVREDNAKY